MNLADRQGFAPLIIIGIIAALVVAGIVGYFALGNGRSHSNSTAESSCYQKVANLNNAIAIDFYSNSDFSKIQAIAAGLKLNQSGDTVTAYSAEQRLDLFKQMHVNDPAIMNALNELDANPLEPDMDITIPQNGDVSGTIDYVNNEANKYGVVINTIQQIVTPDTKKQLLDTISSLQNSTSVAAAAYLQEICANVTSSPFSSNP